MPDDERPESAAAAAASQANQRAREASKVKYVKPKVLAIDLPAAEFKEVAEGGFNVNPGTFGHLIETRASDRWEYVPFAAVLPNASEQEIIVANLGSGEPAVVASGEKAPIGKRSLWQHVGGGVLDPRPRSAAAFRPDFDRIYANGGIFVVFTDTKITPEHRWGESNGVTADIYESVTVSNWDFLSVLDDFRITDATGSEIHVAGDRLSPLSEALDAGGEYTCLVEPPSWMQSHWIELAHTKFGDPIAGILLPPEEHPKFGAVIILPRLGQMGKLVRTLLETFLPSVAPKLFPQDDRQAWINNDAYALPGVLELQGQIREIEAESETRIRALRDEINDKRAEHAFLHDILTEQHGELVQAVQRTLEMLGFEGIIDVDELEGVEDGRLREDLRVKNDSDTVLIEVKGVTNIPRDSEALQVGKYIPVRMKQWRDPDVRGLSIINHQRGLPPLERESENVFHDDIRTNAETHDFGLLTTWDLYRLARSFRALAWRHEEIRDRLLKTRGVIDPVPAHYELVGQIDGFFEKAEAVTIQLIDGQTVSRGDRLAYELPIEFVEEDISSIQIDGADVERAEGIRVGIRTQLRKTQARTNVRVFKVSRRP